MSVGSRLNDPYFFGGSNQVTVDTTTPVTLDGRGYLVDTSSQAPSQERFRRTSVQLLSTQQNIEKGESSLTTPEVWRRVYKSWHHGMGQAFADREDSDQFRYDWSKGIDVWNRWELCLLHDTATVGQQSAEFGVNANGVVVSIAPDRRSLTLTDGTITTTHGPLAADSILFTDGYYLYAGQPSANVIVPYLVASDGVAITVTEQTKITTHFATTDLPTLFVFANLKLVAATQSGKLHDISAYLGTGTKPTTLPAAFYTPAIPNTTFVSGCAGRKSIYMMSATGDKSVIHSVTVKPDAAQDVLLYDGVVAELPDGEVGRCLYSYLGYVAIGTSKGFRFAAVGDGITYGPLIETPGPVTAFEGQGKFLYYALPNFHGDIGIGRADLSEFVADLQPSYASDLMSKGGHAGGEVSFISTLRDGSIIFGTTDHGVWQEQKTYVESGEIVLSAFTFNVTDSKTGLYVATQTSSGTGGGGSMWVSYDKSKSEVFLGTYQQANHRFSMSGAQFYSAALRGTLDGNPSDRTVTPSVYSVEMRATYVRGKASEWQVPCILHDEIMGENNAITGRDVVADFQHLLSLVESGKQFVYIEDGQQWTVYATDFIWSPMRRSATLGWQGVFTIYFREVR